MWVEPSMSFAIKNSLTKGILIKYVGDAVRLALRKSMREGMIMMMIIDGSQLMMVQLDFLTLQWASQVVLVVKTACQGRKLKADRFYPWVRKIPWRRAWQPTPAFLPGESHGQRIGSQRVRHD